MKKMITFIIWLRCVAAILITNSHYGGIYPITSLASGGLIGDIVFFSVSGYCLTNIKTNFCQWYARRLIRILPAVVIISAFYLLIGQYNIDVYARDTEKTLFFNFLSSLEIVYPTWLSWLIYPTPYHFVVSILLLYIPYYFLMKYEWTRQNIPIIMSLVFLVYMIIYMFFYDKSYYHIDDVREPMIRFLFMESMLLGAWFKINDEKFRNTGNSKIIAIGLVFVFVVYLLSRMIALEGDVLQYQFVKQVLIFMLLYMIMRFFSSVDVYLSNVHKYLNVVVKGIACLTLEIYLVQHVLIDIVKEQKIFFPLNWFLVTLFIVLVAAILYFIVKVVISKIGKMNMYIKGVKYRL